LAGEGAGFASYVLAEIGVKSNMGGGVVELDGGEGFEDVDVDREFFFQFAEESLFEGFGGLVFAAGEFPEAAEGGVGVALADQDAPRSENDADGDFDGVHACCHA